MRATIALLLLSTACGDDGGSQADAPIGGPDGGGPTVDGGPGSPDGGGATPDGSIATCGDDVLPTADVTGTEGIAIAPDGTLYYSQGGAVGRVLPGGAADDDFVTFGGAGDTVWGMAVDAAGDNLYVAAPDDSTIYRIDLTAGTPAAVPLAEGVGNPNGLTIGPDGAVYYSHFADTGRVYRVDVATGERTEVTIGPINAPNGLYFESSTSLLVEAYFTGQIWRLTLDGTGVENDRTLVAALDASPDGIGRDDQGRWYVTDNSAGRLLRLEADFSNDADPEVLLEGVSAAANVAWGKGPLDCNDVYVASGGQLGRFAAGVTGTP